MSDAARDEFNALVSSRQRMSSHPEDALSDDGTTLAPSTKSVPSSKSSRTASSSLKKPSLQSHSSNNSSKFPYDDDSSDQDEEPEAYRPPPPSTYYIPRTYDRAAMTGPKGVIADAGAFEQEKRAPRSKSYERTKDLHLPKAQRFGGLSPRRNGVKSPSLSGSDENLSNIDEDEEELRLKEKRFRELQNGMPARTRPKRTYEGLEIVDGLRFLEAVERAKWGVIVLVYLYDRHSQLSEEYARCVAQVSARYSNLQAIALHYDDAEIDPAAIPAILAYKNGDKFADIMPLIDEVPLTSSVNTNLEDALRERAVI